VIPARIELDFAPPHRRFPVLGFGILVIGVLACTQTVSDYRDRQVESELLAMNLSRYQRAVTPDTVNGGTVDSADVSTATEMLLTPWSQLLSDLEVAATDSGKDIALLEIAPDRTKQTVRISGEARTLQHALDYVARLQGFESLRYPLLENHEIQNGSYERPVRFVIQADWRIQP